MPDQLDADLATAIDAAERHIWSGTAYRHTAPDRPALSGSGAALFGGRWNPPGTAAIYLTASVETCVAEFKRMARGQARGAASFLPRDLHEISVANVALLDLTQAPLRRRLRITLGDIQDREWTKCQAIGRQAQVSGFQGLRAPSATRHGEVIVVFETNLRRGQLELIATRPLLL